LEIFDSEFAKTDQCASRLDATESCPPNSGGNRPRQSRRTEVGEGGAGYRGLRLAAAVHAHLHCNHIVMPVSKPKIARSSSLEAINEAANVEGVVARQNKEKQPLYRWLTLKSMID
jgi:hypothetical protein